MEKLNKVPQSVPIKTNSLFTHVIQNARELYYSEEFLCFIFSKKIILTVISRSIIIPRSTFTSKRCKAYCELKAIQTRSKERNSVDIEMISEQTFRKNNSTIKCG